MLNTICPTLALNWVYIVFPIQELQSRISEFIWSVVTCSALAVNKDFSVSRRNNSCSTVHIYCRNIMRFFFHKTCINFPLLFCYKDPTGKWKRKKRNYSKRSFWVKSVSATACTWALAHNLLCKIARCPSFVYLLFRL